MNEPMRPRLHALLLLFTALLISACSQQSAEPPLHGARIGGPFALTDQNGRTVRDSDFAGRYRIVYFGYTFCPDVCPTDLQTIGQALKKFEASAPDRAARVQPIFITVDPDRDTPPVLKQYVSAFHPRLIGLTGTPEQIAAVSKEFGIYASRHPADTPGTYFVDHSRQTVLFGPSGDPMLLLPTDQGVDAVVQALNQWVK